MEPNEILIHSRLKEIFGLDLQMKAWKRSLVSLYNL